MLPYDRAAAVAYAARWALARNPRWADFSHMGGDCANFVSQCLYAGSRVMNPAPDTGWYYRSLADRAPAWSGVTFLHRFLTRSTGPGPSGVRTPLSALQPGDVLFLSDGRRLYHALLIVSSGSDPFIAAHTADSWMRPLSSYEHHSCLPVHITGVA